MELSRISEKDGSFTYLISAANGRNVLLRLTPDEIKGIVSNYDRMIAEDRSREVDAREKAERDEWRAKELAARRVETIDGEEWTIQGSYGSSNSYADRAAWPAKFAERDDAPMIARWDGIMGKGTLPYVIETTPHSWRKNARNNLAGKNGNPRRFATIKAAIKVIQFETKKPAAETV